jgi:hypothetical protein
MRFPATVSTAKFDKLVLRGNTGATAVRVCSKASTMKALQPNVRAAVSNTAHTLEGVDGRSSEARRFRDLLHSITNDLGGVGVLSTYELSLARQCAALMLRSDQVEAAVVRGDTNADELTRLADQVRRVLGDLQVTVERRTMAAA